LYGLSDLEMPHYRRKRTVKAKPPPPTTSPDDECLNAVAPKKDSVDDHRNSVNESIVILNEKQIDDESSSKLANLESIPPSIESVHKVTDQNDQIQKVDITDIIENQGALNMEEKTDCRIPSDFSQQSTSVNKLPSCSNFEEIVSVDVDKIVVDNIENLQEKVFQMRENRKYNFNIMRVSFLESSIPMCFSLTSLMNILPSFPIEFLSSLLPLQERNLWSCVYTLQTSRDSVLCLFDQAL
jgi:hypothetical protein